MRLLAEDTMALIIDFQEKLMPVMAEREALEKRTDILLRGLKALDVPMVMTQQYTRGIGMTIPAVREAAGSDEYFDKLSENIYQFSSSGSGPVNALVQGEAVIGLGMTFHAVQEINNGTNLEILYFDEGSPYAITGTAVIDGRLEKTAVKEVFDFLMNTLCEEDKEQFSPEAIFKDQATSMENYPQNISYSDMTGIDDLDAKEKLLAQWKY